MSCLKGEQRLLHFSTAIKVLPLENDDSVTEEDFVFDVGIGIFKINLKFFINMLFVFMLFVYIPCYLYLLYDLYSYVDRNSTRNST